MACPWPPAASPSGATTSEACEGNPDPAVFERWLAFGLLSSHSRLHGCSSYRVPWAFDLQAVDVARRFTKLKVQLMPYLARLAREAHESGAPLLRPMFLEFPEDRAVAHLDAQYMLGPSLLVVRVFSADGQVEYYLPEGKWHHLLTGEAVEGGSRHSEQHGFDSSPLLVRPATVLPVGARGDQPDYDYPTGLTLSCFALADGDSVSLDVPHQGSGGPDRAVVTRVGELIRAQVDDAVTFGAWTLEVVGAARVSTIAGHSVLELRLPEECDAPVTGGGAVSTTRGAGGDVAPRPSSGPHYSPQGSGVAVVESRAARGRGRSAASVRPLSPRLQSSGAAGLNLHSEEVVDLRPPPAPVRRSVPVRGRPRQPGRRR